MKNYLLAVTLLGAAVTSQPCLAQAKEASGKKRDYEVTLSAYSDVLVADRDVKLILRVQTHKDCVVSSTVLAGWDLEVKVDGKDGPKIKKTVGGAVRLAADTRIERTITIPCKQIFPMGSPTDMTRVTFAWPSFIGAGATLTVAPDLSKVKVDDLDLAKTTVTLITNYGNMTIKFRPDKAPKTVRNFVKLSKDGFYDGTRFHRVMKGFMIQGGCPNTKEGATGMPGTGDPGYKLKAEFNDLRHKRGVLSMARGRSPDSAGCQFFIMDATNRGLDGQYTAFGELTSGFETLDKIVSVPCSYVNTGGRPEKSKPIKPVHLKAAIVNPAFKKK